MTKIAARECNSKFICTFCIGFARDENHTWLQLAVFSSSIPATLIELLLNIAQISMG